MAVSSREMDHHTISGNISPIQIHQKLKKGCATVAVCRFCYKTMSGCSTQRNCHILGRPVLGPTKAGIGTCIAINKNDDDTRAILKNAQLALSKVMLGKEEAASC